MYFSRIHFSILLVASFVGWSTTVLAQDASPTAASPAVAVEKTETVTQEQIENLKSRVEAATDLTEEAKKTALDALQSAVVSLAGYNDLLAREKAAQDAIKSVDTRRTTFQNQLDELKKRTLPEPSPEEELPKLEQELAGLRAQLAQEQGDLNAIETNLNNRADLQKQRKERILAIPAEKEELAKQMALQPPPAERDLVAQAKNLAYRAEKTRLDAEPATLQVELAKLSAEDSASLIQLQQQIHTINLEFLKQQIQKYSDTINIAKRTDAQSRKKTTQEQIAALDPEVPWQKDLISVFEENLTIIEDVLRVQLKVQSLQDDVEQIRQDYDALSDEFEQSKNRGGRTGMSRLFGIRLRQQRKLLPSVYLIRNQVQHKMEQYEDAQIAYLDNREAQKKLDDLSEEIEQVLISATHLPADQELTDGEVEVQSQQQAEIRQQIQEAFEQQREYRTLQGSAYDNQVRELENYETGQLQLIELSQQFAKYIDERVLWIRSHEALRFLSVIGDVDSLSLLVDMQRWRIIGSLLVTDFWSHLFIYSLFLVIWCFLWGTQAQQTTRIKQTSKKAASRLNTSMKPTFQACLMTVSKASILPLPLLFLGWRLYATTLGTNLSEQAMAVTLDLGTNLRQAGYAFFLLEFIRNVHRPQGIAQSHFGWGEQGCKLVHQQIHSFIVFVAPLALLIAVLSAWKSDSDSDALSRVFSIAIYLLLTFTLRRLVDVKAGPMSEWIGQSENGWFVRFASIMHWLASAIPLALGVLTAIGYAYTANRLALKLAQSLVLVFGAVFLRSLLLRWLSMRYRRIALEQARQARAAMANVDPTKDSTVRAVVSDGQEQKTALAEVSAQTSRLLNTSIVLFSLIGTWLIWTDVLPALHYFDSFTLPGTQVRIPSLISALVISALTATAARNVPGLMQITVLEWLPLEKSSRYAIAAVSQYLIAIVGLLAISGQLGIGWDQVQWLAAALTFGLGFGLQEIFANFVSGLIILFEQPVRVGDVVTIDGVSGAVSRIRIRSTTITDWDRKEYIVPNREFITGKLLNWTLTDTVNRITIQVGVAYGTNPSLVQQIIYKIADDHPFVLRTPEPVVVFDCFGESSLDFKLMAFLPSLDQRLKTIHEIHVAINKELADAGIEIPFPQRDLHLRSAVPFPVVNDSKAPPGIVPLPTDVDSLTEE